VAKNSAAASSATLNTDAIAREDSGLAPIVLLLWLSVLLSTSGAGRPRVRAIPTKW
jgi:hypothetical protein